MIYLFLLSAEKNVLQTIVLIKSLVLISENVIFKKVKATSSVDLQEADKHKLSEYLENCIRVSLRRSYLPFWKKYQEFVLVGSLI